MNFSTNDLMETIEGYFRKYSDIQYREVKDWAERRLKSDLAREGFWNDIKHKHKGDYPPLITKLEEILSSSAPIENQNYSTGTKLGLNSKQIYERIVAIRTKQSSGVRLKNIEVDFLATWSKVEQYWEALSEAGEDPFEMCENVRRCIEMGRGKEVLPINTRTASDVWKYIEKVAGNLTTIIERAVA